MERAWFLSLPALRSRKAVQAKAHNGQPNGAPTHVDHLKETLTTIAATGAAAAVASAAVGRGLRSLGLDVALRRAGGGLVHGLNGDVGLLFTLLVVA